MIISLLRRQNEPNRWAVDRMAGYSRLDRPAQSGELSEKSCEIE